VEEDSTAAVGFMEVAGEGFTGVEVSPAEVTLVTAAGTPQADIMAAATTAVTEGLRGVAGATAGASGATLGAVDMGGTATAGDLPSDGRIGVGDGDIRMATATAPGMTLLTFMILTHTMVLQTIRRTIGILTMRTTILPRQIPADGPRPTRTDLQDPGDLRYREARPRRPTQTATSRPLHRVRRFAPLTG